jgi:hypothetical protein
MRPIALLLLSLLACDDGMTRLDAADGVGAAKEIWQHAERRERLEVFDWGDGITTSVSDFLFVVDPSISMHNVLQQVDAGFLALSESEVFPTKSRIAVMSTTPIRTAGTSAKEWLAKKKIDSPFARAPHSSVRNFPAVAFMPGLGGLVDHEAILRFRTHAPPDLAVAWEMDGCSAWFRPDDKNATDENCLLAHTQSVLTPLRAEAGLVALDQMVKASDGLVFRPGAQVNVIFVSDTHDPGVANPERSASTAALAALTPDPLALEKTLVTTQGVAGVRFHAIAPATECGELWSPAGATYYRAADATGGIHADVCTVGDYAPVIRRIVELGAIPEAPVLALGQPAEAIEEVRVDGRPTGFTVVGDSRAVAVDGVDRDVPHEIEVRYRYPEIRTPTQLPVERTPEVPRRLPVSPGTPGERTEVPGAPSGSPTVRPGLQQPGAQPSVTGAAPAKAPVEVPRPRR